MAYSELTCDDDGLTVEQLERMSTVVLPDGSKAWRVVIVTLSASGDFNNDFNNDFNI